MRATRRRSRPAHRRTLRNTSAGEITVCCDSLKLVELDQHLVLYTAASGTPGADKLALLAVLGHQKVDTKTDQPEPLRVKSVKLST
ncbi:hypothetical protein CH262_25755 [Rhodococcus sp. 05-2255-1e]|nr:hypothetical protein CH262_25755 [Rhodococcus sp. 05-2255-1e]